MVFVRQDADGRDKKVWGLFRGFANVGLALYGTVCSEHQQKTQRLLWIAPIFKHGVLGVECSNHSVPTI